MVWTNQQRRHVQIRSDINYRIAELFGEREIKIPYPTHEFLLKGGAGDGTAQNVAWRGAAR